MKEESKIQQIRKERMISVSPYSVEAKRKHKTLFSQQQNGPNNPTPQDENSKVKVFVRVRPFNEKEHSCGCKVINVVDNNTLVFDPKETNEPFFFRGVVQKSRDINKRANKDMLFEFDRVFDEEASNEDVFNVTTKEIVKSIFEGYNCSVFAYGATGAGKTFTMLGTEDRPGITFLTIVELLKQVEESNEELNVTLGVSYIEVYNENVRDLLHPNADILQLREEGGRVTISGLVVEKIISSDHLFSLLNTGNQNRSQHPTDSNSESSRSHAVFQVHVRMDYRGTLKLAKLSMIDLAGSERGSSTGCKGIRFKEGSNINKSLLALGNCINALAEGLKHIPYRDSKLTRILKDSLGGNCQTMMIANISPSSSSFEDTYNTLKYATRAKCIKSKITKNVMNETYSIAHYKKLNEELQRRISKLEENAIPEVGQWISKIQSIMEERLKIYKEIIALESQKKLTEWRLGHKAITQSLYDPTINDSQRLNRINASVMQLKARTETVKYRLDEYPPSLAANEEMLNSLTSEINKNTKLSQLLQPMIDLYHRQITIEIQEQSMEHLYKVIRLKDKQEEIYTTTIGRVLPVFKEFYILLRSFGHTNEDISAKYEDIAKSLESIKAVTWNEETEESSDEGNAKSNLRLSLSRLQVIPDILNAGAGGEPYDFNKTITLKENQQPMKSTTFGGGPIKSVMPITKNRTFIKPRLAMNKENVKLPVVGTPLSKLPPYALSSGFKPKSLTKRGFPLRSLPNQSTVLNAKSYVKFKATSTRKVPSISKAVR
ncbi:kinesin-like protein KIF18A isoform X2 [Cimex lectularius]|uniref:Kinesin-like protein n=1 Tax=Cimex lectularius TaxID=79782 RepID=A0A8I6REX1_CIMLE|nr:kinesin-like protein KIF18A isoform X2 [Cimex lectularius]